MLLRCGRTVANHSQSLAISSAPKTLARKTSGNLELPPSDAVSVVRTKRAKWPRRRSLERQPKMPPAQR